jgi:TonB family protein
MRPFLAAPLRSALALVVLASSCTQAPAPTTPDETPESQNAVLEPAASESPALEGPAPDPAAAPSGTEPSGPAAAGTASAGVAASGAPGTPKDTRGKAEIQQVMASNRDKVRACYEAALATNPGIKGDLVIDFTIDPHGAVKQAEINWSQSDLHIPELDTCAVDAVRSLQFPASSRGLESKVSYPFNFNPPRAGKPAAREEPAGPSR